MMLFVLIIQMSFGRFGLGPQRIMPDLLLMMAVIVAFRGPADQAPVAGCVLGILKDLSSLAPLGTYTITLGLLTWAIVRIRDVFYGEHPLALILIMFVGSFLVETLALGISLLKQEMNRSDPWMVIFFTALLTAGVAPYAQWIIMKFHRQLGIPQRRSYG